MRQNKESRLLSWGSFLLLLLVLDLCYALGEGGVTTITDGRKCQRGISEGESPPYMRGRRIPTVVVGVASPSFPCARQFGVMHSGTKGGATITDGRKCQRGISEGEFHHIYMRGRRIPTVVVGVASPSFPCARHFGVMHSGTKGGAIITNGRMYTPRELRVFKKRLDRPIVNP